VVPLPAAALIFGGTTAGALGAAPAVPAAVGGAATAPAPLGAGALVPLPAAALGESCVLVVALHAPNASESTALSATPLIVTYPSNVTNPSLEQLLVLTVMIGYDSYTSERGSTLCALAKTRKR
jgi:hypothetical protein